jgi:hypothetical protein
MMGKVNELLQTAYERIGDQYPGEIDRAEAEKQLEALGFAEDEIAEHLDELDEDDGRRSCATCSGTGIGQSGDPDTSNCSSCKGRGYHLPEPEDDGDRRYDEWKDRKMEEENGY